MKKIAIVMGSKTDWKVMKQATVALDLFSLPFVVEVISAHRTPEKMISFAQQAKEKNIAVIIAGAGGAAHLPGMIAAVTTLPVIGVPVEIGKLKGIDALLSIAQMPQGVPVATVAIDNAFNAGLLAAQILSIESEKLSQRLLKFKQKQKLKVKMMNKAIRAHSKSRKGKL